MTALLWPALMLFMLGSLFAALNWYFAQDLEGFSLASLSAVHLLVAVGLQFLAIAAVVLSWHINLRGQGIHPLAFDQSVIMVGISTIGKYTPGKVWGMLARSVRTTHFSTVLSWGTRGSSTFTRSGSTITTRSPAWLMM